MGEREVEIRVCGLAAHEPFEDLRAFRGSPRLSQDGRALHGDREIVRELCERLLRRLKGPFRVLLGPVGRDDQGTRAGCDLRVQFGDLGVDSPGGLEIFARLLDRTKHFKELKTDADVTALVGLLGGVVENLAQALRRFVIAPLSLQQGDNIKANVEVIRLKSLSCL